MTMLLNCALDSRKILPVALIMFSVGLFVLSCGITWQHTFSPLLRLSTGLDDFFRGFCMGLGIVLEAGAFVMLLQVGRGRLNS